MYLFYFGCFFIVTNTLTHFFMLFHAAKILIFFDTSTDVISTGVQIVPHLESS